MNSVQNVLRQYSESPIEINRGLCDHFSEALIKEFNRVGIEARQCVTPEDVELPGHYWVETAEGRCYDAETPEGVFFWYELPIFTRQLKNNIT